jgi:hypothetical protein
LFSSAFVNAAANISHKMLKITFFIMGKSSTWNRLNQVF